MLKILIPLDGSSTTEEVLERGLSHYSPETTELILFHCVDLNSIFSGLGHSQPSSYIDTEAQNRKEKQVYLNKLSLKLEERGYKSKSIIEMGAPVDRIVGHAKADNVDLILMTTHARSGLERLFVGSVTEGVLRRAECLVLVIPIKG